MANCGDKAEGRLLSSWDKRIGDTYSTLGGVESVRGVEIAYEGWDDKLCILNVVMTRDLVLPLGEYVEDAIQVVWSESRG